MRSETHGHSIRAAASRYARAEVDIASQRVWQRGDSWRYAMTEQYSATPATTTPERSAAKIR
jgi:hypothetical protein